MPAVMPLGHHPLQRAGARACAVLTHREFPQQMTVDDVEAAAEHLVDVLTETACAGRQSRRYELWKAVLALFPNSPATHAKRPREPHELRARIAALFTPDEQMDGRARPCAFCYQPARARWAKSLLPMHDKATVLNNLPSGGGGWSICRACRIAMWALPYGAWATAHLVGVLSAESEEVEQEWARQCVARTTHLWLDPSSPSPLPVHSPHALAVRLLRTHHQDELCGATLYQLRNDNESPVLAVSVGRRGLLPFLHQQHARLAVLQQALTVDHPASAARRGEDEVAWALFDTEGYPKHLLLYRIIESLPKTTDAAERHGLIELGVAYGAWAYGAPEREAVQTCAEKIAGHCRSSRERRELYERHWDSQIDVARMLHQAGAARDWGHGRTLMEVGGDLLALIYLHVRQHLLS